MVKLEKMQYPEQRHPCGSIAHRGKKERVFLRLIPAGSIVPIMSRKPVARRVLAVLVGVALVLTIALAALLVTGHVLGKMGDAAGREVLDAIALGVGVVWVVDMVCLVLALGTNALVEGENPPDEPY